MRTTTERNKLDALWLEASTALLRVRVRALGGIVRWASRRISRHGIDAEGYLVR